MATKQVFEIIALAPIPAGVELTSKTRVLFKQTRPGIDDEPFGGGKIGTITDERGEEGQESAAE